MSRYLALVGLAKGNTDFVTSWNSHARGQHAMNELWIGAMRSMGVKAAHPDDGWVNRKHNTVQFAYPDFNDGPQVGDLIVLGEWHKMRLVRVTKISTTFLGDHSIYHFDIAYLGVRG